MGFFAFALEVKAPNAELHFVPFATEVRLGKHRHRKPLRPDTPNRPRGCGKDLEPRRLERRRRRDGGGWREIDGGGMEEEGNEEDR